MPDNRFTALSAKELRLMDEDALARIRTILLKGIQDARLVIANDGADKEVRPGLTYRLSLELCEASLKTLEKVMKQKEQNR